MSIEAKRGIHFIPGRARIDILPNTQKKQFLVAKLWPWTGILIFCFRLIFICICIVWRSPDKNTIMHAGQKIGQKLGVLRAFATYKMTITITFWDLFCFVFLVCLF